MGLLQLLAATYFLFTPIQAQAFYAGPPIVLYKIAECESGSRQYTDSGKVLISKTHDYGLFQINAMHLKEAKAMGYDITTPEGNTAYAVYLYNTQGTSPWNPSKKCWDPST